jgi:hypothetical protein
MKCSAFQTSQGPPINLPALETATFRLILNQWLFTPIRLKRIGSQARRECPSLLLFDGLWKGANDGKRHTPVKIGSATIPGRPCPKTKTAGSFNPAVKNLRRLTSNEPN